VSAPACHTPESGQTEVRRPWNGDPRADAKDALLAYAVENAYSVPVVRAVRAVLDPDAEAGDADHRLALRFYTEDYAHLFKTTRRGGFVCVEPEPWAFVLKSSRQTSPQMSTSTPNPQRATGSLPRRAPGGRAASTARSVLRERCSITPGSRGEGVRSALTHALAAHREGVDVEGMRDDRVSSVSRVGRRQAVYLSAFEAAARRYREGVLLTLTSRPGESGDMIDSAVAVNDSADPLRKWLRRRGVADAVVVRELTKRGVLHLHVVAFGITKSDVDRDALGRYWHNRRGHGFVVDVEPVERRVVRDADALGGRRPWWVFADHADAPTKRGRFVASYLADGLFRFRDVAEASPGEIHADAVADGEWWRVAALWATGLPVVTVSEGLRSTCWRDVSHRRGLRGCRMKPHMSLVCPNDRPQRWVDGKLNGLVVGGMGKPPPSGAFRLGALSTLSEACHQPDRASSSTGRRLCQTGSIAFL